MRNFRAAAIVSGVWLAATPAFAADLFTSSAPAGLAAPTEVGSNWYIRGDVGVGIGKGPVPTFSGFGVPPSGDSATQQSTTFGALTSFQNANFDVGLGYRFNDNFRTDATFEFRRGPSQNAQSNSTIVCPYQAITLDRTINQVATAIGQLYDVKDTCNGYLGFKQRNYMAMANGYWDITTWNGFTPYVGAGLGLNANTSSGSLTYNETANGKTYAADLTEANGTPAIWLNANGTPVNAAGQPSKTQPAIAFAPQNWNRTFGGVKYSPAIALMAGVSYQWTPNIALDLSYRYLATGAVTVSTTTQSGTTTSKSAPTEQSVRLGVRFSPD